MCPCVCDSAWLNFFLSTLSSLAFLTPTLKDNPTQETRFDSMLYCKEQSGLSLNWAYLIPLWISWDWLPWKVPWPFFFSLNIFVNSSISAWRYSLEEQALYELDWTLTCNLQTIRWSGTSIKLNTLFHCSILGDKHCSCFVCGCAEDRNACK